MTPFEIYPEVSTFQLLQVKPPWTFTCKSLWTWISCNSTSLSGISFPLSSPQRIEEASLSFTEGSHSFCFTHRDTLPVHATPPLCTLPPWCPYICSLHLCFCFAIKIIYHFSIFYICMLIYDICCSFSDLLQSVWQSLGLATSLQVPKCHSFHGWVVFHCTYM